MTTRTLNIRDFARRATMTLLLLLVTATTAWAKDPFGYVNVCTGHHGSIYLELWALDEDDLNARTTIHVYLRQNGQDKYFYNLGATDLYRADAINPQFAGDHEMHRYLNVPVAGTYDVYVYVLNAAGGGTNPLCEHAWKGAPYPNYASVTTSSPYTVTYNANGGSGAPAATTKSYGINLTLSSTQPTRSGYLFTGWNTAADGSGTTYNSGAAYTGNANLTLYAQWAQSGNNSVEMASGTHDASHWSFSSNTANFGNTITVNYSGSLNLESVTLRRKTTNTYDLNSSNISTAVSNFNSNSGSKLVFTANISEQQTFTCTEGEIDMNGHSSSKDLFIQNNVLGKTITIKNGTVTGTDGAGGFNDYYNGTVVLENMTVTGRVWTDGHSYVINGGTYNEIINDKNANTPSIVTIYNGKISQLGNWGSGGTFTLYGGKYAINPSSLSYCTIPSGYSVQSNTDSDSGTYPWVVRNTSSPVANPYSLAVTEVTANRQWTFTMPPYDVEVVAHYAPSIPYFAYNTTTKTYETLDANNFTAFTAGTTAMSGGWYVVNSNVTVSDRIEVTGTVNLILCDGKTLTATQGLHVPTGVTLNIYGQSGGTGGLTVTQGGSDQAGIGGNNGEVSGTITIHGGNVTSTGGWSGAGIGGGHDRPCGSITIYGGTVNAHGGDRAAGIGGGSGEYSGGTITIMGGTVTAWANNLSNDYDNSQAIGVGLSSNPGTCTLNLGDMKVYNSANATTPVASTGRESTCRSKYVMLTTCDHHYVNDECTYCGADKYYAPRQYFAYETASQSFVLRSAYEFTYVTSNITTMGTDGSEKYYVVKNDVSIGSRIEVRGTVHLILCDGKTLTASKGITVNSGNTLNIYGQTAGTGALDATGVKLGGDGTEAAAIGSTGHTTVGNITIHGGLINANGASWSAGIGGGVSAGGGSVKIYGGSVNATGHDGTSEAIGRGSGGGSVSKTIADGLCVKVNNSSTPVAYGDRVSSLGQQVAVVEPCTEHNFSNDICTYCGFPRYGHVTYNDNNATSGTVPTDATNYESYTVITVPDNTGNLARIGYTFAGWNTAANGSGIDYAPGASLTILGNIILYAQWTPINYTVRFHKNHDDATGTMSEQTFTFDVVQPLTVNAFTLDNYLFAGWNTTTNGIVTYTDGQSVSNLAIVQDAVVNLYALWTQNQYTITYDLAGGSVATPNPTTYTDLSKAITLANPTREGYGFIGWTGTGLSEPTMTVTIPAGSTGNRSYTANWRPGVVYYAYNTTIQMFESFTVFDNYNSVTAETTSMSSGLYVVDDDVTISDRIEVTGTVDLILCDGKTLTATNGFHVLDGNTLNIYGQTNGTGTLIATNHLGGAAIGGTGNANEKSGTVTIHGGTVTATGDLYAGGIGCGWYGQVGTIAVYGGTVTANGGGYGAGLGGGRDSRCGDVIILGGTVVATSVNNPPLVYGKGILGGGSLTLGNVKVFSDDTTPVAYTDRIESCTSEPHSYPSVRIETCTSHNWDNGVCTFCGAHHVTVTYDSNGATGGTAPIDALGYEPSQTFTVLGNTGNMVRTGYFFSGWNTAADGSGTNFAPGSMYIINADITLYAQWSVAELALANNGNNSNAISTAAASGLYHNVTLADRTIYTDGDWNTLCLPFGVDNFTGTPLEGATVKTLESTDFADGTLTMNFSDDLTSIEAGKPYIVKWTKADLVIRTADDWNTFATNVNNGTESYQGKTVKLAANISVSTMVGTDGKEFKGTFDGCGHTLMFNYTTDADNAAPFQWIKNAVIKNLKVMGEITSSKMFAAGFVARAHGDNAIENCVSGVIIHATKVGDGTHGGFVGRIESDCQTFTFTDCKFNGTFDGSNTDNWCPFAAWSMGNSNTNFIFNNCLCSPTGANVRSGNATFYRNGTPTLNGAYYTQTIGTVQGTNASGMSNETLASNLGDGWEISGGNVVPKMLNTANDIVNPVFKDVIIGTTATANVETDYADFVGTYTYMGFNADDRSILFLGTENTLYYPLSGASIGACRAYFQLKQELTAGGTDANAIKAFNLNFGDGETTGIEEIVNSKSSNSQSLDAWYDLSGRKLNAQPTVKGIYIHGGRKVVVP